MNFCFAHRDEWFSLASVPALQGQVASLFSFSKGYAMSGFRVGYMVVPEWLRREVLKVHDATLICTPRASQVAALAALDTGAAHLAAFETTLRRRRELICRRLDRLPHVFAYRCPEAAYYLFPRITAAHESSRAFCLDVLESARVTLTPGSAFGPSGEHHVRMAFCVDDTVIETAFDRLEARFA
jgi:aspartate/methionine/tyrosine aminotransferase